MAYAICIAACMHARRPLMYAIGHVALGYFTGKAVGKATKSTPNYFFVWILVVLPDLDLLFGRFLIHRGPTHSVVVVALIFAPLLALTPRKAAPYFTALASHSLIGDCITGGCQLLWPLSAALMSVNSELQVGSINEVILEIMLFISMTIAIIATKDYRITHKSSGCMV